MARARHNSQQRSLFDDLDEPLVSPAPLSPPVEPPPPPVPPTPVVATTSGEKAKAHEILEAVRTLKKVEADHRAAAVPEREVLARFCGFGPVALSLFPDPIEGTYKDASWEVLGKQLRALLTDDEYESAKRSVYNAFYTAPVVITAMHDALARLGLPANAQVLEPGCGAGRFMAQAPEGMRFIGVELDGISGRIARLLHTSQDIRIQNFRDTKLPPLDGVIGNVPFANVKLEHAGTRWSLHDYFFAKSVDALKPGGVLALVTSHYTLDKQNAAIREYLSDRADFLGAIRLPSDAFKKEGTAVVTDIVFLRKRAPGEPENHVDYEWKESAPHAVEESFVPINRYFLNHPEMVLGTFTSKDSLYGEGYSVVSNGDLAEQLKQAVAQLPWFEPERCEAQQANPPPAETHHPTSRNTPPPFVPPPPERHITEGSFFVHDSRIHQLVDGQSAPVVYGGSELWANGALFGRRMGALIDLRDKARYVLRSQNEGWPESARADARRALNATYDRFKSAYGPINKTTLSETQDGGTIRRMPNLAKFREDPDAMLVMALEEYDEATGEAAKAPILLRDVVGKTPPVTSVTTAEEGLLVSLDRKGLVDLPYIAELYGKPQAEVIAELGDLIYFDTEANCWETADAYLSGNVRAKLASAEKAGTDYERNVEALKAVQPEDVLPGDIDANLGAPWIPASDVQQFATELFQIEPGAVTIGHMPKDAVWSVEGDWSAERSVSVTSDYGTARANGLWLLDLALNMKTPLIYDPAPGDPDKRVVNQEQTLAAKEKQKLIKERFRQWVFADPDRTERLVRLYNDNFNCLRPRQFDGSHLEFPGMSQALVPRQHQRDAVWRGMSSGNTLLAHIVGAGKSLVLAATAMKLRQAGLVKKPVIIIPNHLLEQFTREFQQIYPNAKLLMAGKDDFAKDRRKLLTAKIASGDWDAVIMTHSSFERLGMSKEFQERFLREQIAEYDELLIDQARQKQSKAARNVIKSIEKQKAAREAKLKDLLAEEKKDSGLVFDELGIDHIMVDECFTYDTLVETDRGPVKIGDIVSNRLRVSLRTWNKQTGMIEWKPVVNWFTNKRKEPLVEVVHEFGSFICTKSHKIWVAGYGYKAAGSLVADETLLVLRSGIHHSVPTPQGMPGVPDCQADANKAVRMVSGELRLHIAGAGARQQATTSVLLQPMQSPCPAVQPGDRSKIQGGHAPSLGQLAVQGAPEPGGFRVDESQPLCVPPGNRTEDISGVASPGEPSYPSCTRGEREATTSAAITSCRGNRDGHGICHQNASHQAPDGIVASLLQSGSGRSHENAGRGSGRIYPFVGEGKATRREEGQSPIPSRVVRVTVLEPGSDGEYRFGGRTHQVVYDIEVADNHNYFANGALVSNCHYFKNLETPTKMDRVAGVQAGGSERAFDLYMKCRYLHELHPGHGVTFATGTPISNSLVELYTMQRFLDPDGLKARGIEHFDAWAATFGEVVESMEISPDGKTLKPRSRFSKFVNLPELQQMFRAFADVQTAEMLDLPRPKLEGGKPHVVSCPMSDEQAAIQQELVERYERIRNGGVDPRVDNALAITTDGRKLALDARMLSSTALSSAVSKTTAMLENVFRIWQLTASFKGTQMIFSDMGVNPTTWGFSVYNEIVNGLVARGIQRSEIAVMGDAASDAKKQSLFEKVRQGTVRVLIGSTSKMGTGTNVQKRLVAMHHLDAPWKPAEVEQRDGRILRQGNMNDEVSIFRYVTEGSFDAYMWQALETKAKFINQIMTGESGVRQAEDVGGQELSYAEVKAIASGNPAVLTLAEADAELQRLGVLRRNHADEQYIARKKLRELPQDIERQEKRLAALEADAATLAGGDPKVLIVGSRSVVPQDPALGNALNRLPDLVDHRRQFALGKYRGLDFGVMKHTGGAMDVYLEGQAFRADQLFSNSHGPRAVWNALNRLSDSYEERIAGTRQDLDLSRSQLADYEVRLGRQFQHAAYADELTGLRDRLKLALSGTPAEGEPTAAELADRIKGLRAAHQVEAAPARVRSQSRAVKPRRVEQPKQEAVADPEPEIPAQEPPPEDKPADDEPPPRLFQQRVQKKVQRGLF